MAAIKYDSGFIDESREDVNHAIEYAENMEELKTLDELKVIL